MSTITSRTNHTLYLNDSRVQLKTIPDNTVDSVVTDPPYELGFMGKKWDGTGIAYDVEFWKEVFRVMKPGAHLAAFGSSRTYHRLACAIEDAGFEIRDSLMWIYGTGMPKSLNIGKAIDKSLGATRPIVGKSQWSQPAKSGHHAGITDPHVVQTEERYTPDITAPATPEAMLWDGWGTALKPAFEPIVLARKPPEGTIAANVLKWGTGGLNIDACRIGPRDRTAYGLAASQRTQQTTYGTPTANADFDSAKGRWPANLTHDGSPDVTDLFPVTSSGAMKHDVDGYDGDSVTSFIRGRSGPSNQHGDSGSAARFFYSTKTTTKDREEGLDHLATKSPRELVGRDPESIGAKNGRAGAGHQSSGRKNHHPTVKPTALMQWLIRLVTPPGGTVLDPFMGSGSTGKAAMKEGTTFIGIEMDPTYFEVAKARIEHATQPPVTEDTLF